MKHLSLMSMSIPQQSLAKAMIIIFLNGKGMRLIASAIGDVSHIRIDAYIEEPGLQFYSRNFMQSRNKLPHTLLPHYVWINKEGICAGHYFSRRSYGTKY